MKLGLVVNDINTELADYTTTYLAMEATNLGHEVWYININDFIYDPDENVHAYASTLPSLEHSKHYRSAATYLGHLRSSKSEQQRLAFDGLDVLLLRNDPAVDVIKRPWARLAGINFGRLAMRHGVLVLNDPNGLVQAINKIYLQYFPEEIRPRTLISRNRMEIKNFIKEQGGEAVLKPLAGSGGRNVFLINKHEKANINQIIDAVFDEGYVIAQEFLSEALQGDTRLFLVNGQPLQCKGHYAAVHRVRESSNGDMRSNLSVGAVARKAHVDDSMLAVAETIRPKLVQDGMFLVGLDIVSNKLMEINVFSPGGLHCASKLAGVNYIREVVHILEQKVEAMQHYGGDFNNVELATL